MKKLAAVMLLLSTTGCATMHRHPKLTALTFATAGIAIGGTVGYMQRNHFCSYTYDGQPYYGTTCPAPKGDVIRKK